MFPLVQQNLVCARIGWAGQTHTDLFVPSTIHNSLESSLNSLEAIERTHATPKQPAQANASGLCVGGCVWFADARTTTKRRYGTRLGRHKEMEQMGFNVITLLPFVEFPCGEAKPKISFPFLFPLRGGGVGGGGARKMQGNFLVFAHASPRACPRRIVSLHHAIGAYGEV
ncbi:MAG: hypothetical protein COU72_01120 [Parcubacteria group bacterium CG10_big_fil_rev_8_21_14_0_10_41_35]|nr:MAG: hypothetical protein COU72_01120 [Parcubacteria group bacterium CG10_big_fil_rev_8_21_14_0_10_41_35]